MEQLTILILLSFSMLFGSYFSGTIPMVFNLSQERIRSLTILGSGILVGTALSVIIPEGVNTIYQSAHEFEHHLSQGSNAKSTPQHEPNHKSSNNHSHHEDVPHSVVGLTLVIGFVFMLCVDQCISQHSAPPPSGYVSAATTDPDIMENGSGVAVPHVKSRTSKNFTATIGLIVHAAADGIALGAAATTSHTDVEMIVFLAIMLHKAPASFGLVTFLMHEGLERSKIKKHLLAFSLSAPIGAFVTYFGLGASVQETLSDYNATGIAMLFSAGTFLFVATVHVLPEITQHQQLKLSELLLLVGGSFLPSLLTLNHHH